ncbi:hypothetical protein HN011_008199 [Eciton burchellii]|nr:hypothetical protein HN011_008199 [Eciton burchellii]
MITGASHSRQCASAIRARYCARRAKATRRSRARALAHSLACKQAKAGHEQASEQATKQASKQASKQADKQASSRRASERAQRQRRPECTYGGTEEWKRADVKEGECVAVSGGEKGTAGEEVDPLVLRSELPPNRAATA